MSRSNISIAPSRSAHLAACLALVAVHALVGAVLLYRTDTVCFSDCISEFVPQLSAFVRELQSGTLPLADPNTFAGSRQFILASVKLYYPLIFPLYALVDPNNLFQLAAVLIVLPFVLHLTSAALGTYALAAREMRLAPSAAFAAALVYSFSPTLMTFDYLNQASAFSYIPWLTLAMAVVMRTGSARVWVAGVVGMALMNVATNPNPAIRVWFVVGFQAVVLLVLNRRETTLAALLRRLMAVVAMGLVGLAMAGYAWAGLYTSLRWIGEQELSSCSRIMDMGPGSSLAPTALLSLLFPHAYSKPGGDTIHGGGLIVMLIVAVALLAAWRRPRAEGDRRWLWVGISLIGFGVPVVLGKHTPVFEILCHTVPGFFSFPHPVSWALLLSWGFAILAGFGVAHLWSAAPMRRVPSLALAGLALIAAIAATLQPEITTMRWQGPPVGALIYVAIAACAAFACLALPARRVGPALVLLLLFESAVTPITFALAPVDDHPDPRNPASWSVRHEPYAELRPVLAEITANSELRFTGFNSYVDNQAWITDRRALFGHQPIALYPRFWEASKRFAVGHPYSLWLMSLPRFLQNMAVGWLITYRPTAGEIDPPWWTRDYVEVVQPRLQALPLVRQLDRLEVRRVDNPMPYTYLQERLLPAAPAAQLDQLMDGDLRQAAFVDPEILKRLPAYEPSSGDADFDAMQGRNRVVRSDRSRSNRVTIDVELSRPAMLIVAESALPGWRASIDGASGEVLQVNYLQQGIWLPPGPHRVELRYLPDQLLIGLGLSASAALVTAVVWWSTRRASRRRARVGLTHPVD